MSNTLQAIIAKLPNPESLSGGWLQRIKYDALSNITARDYPNTKEESWKYTSLHSLKKTDYVIAGAQDSQKSSNTTYIKENFSESDKIYLVFVDGFFQPGLSSNELSQNGIKIRPLNADKPDDEHDLEPVIKTDLIETFSALNVLSLCDSLLIDVEHNRTIKKAINIVLITESAEPLLKSLRIIVRMNENSEARIVEEYRGTKKGAGFTNAVTNLRLGKNSTLHHHRLQTESAGSVHIGKIEAQVSAGARLLSDSIAMGSKLSRVDIDVSLIGKAAYCRLNGLFTGINEQHVDHHTIIRHQVADTHSDELYRGILDDKSRGVFNGKVVVSKNAQKISARQASNNLLLSKLAEIDTKPELEIYADDVTCAHGATVGQLDETALFYLRSRGINYKDARALLIYAFAEKVIESIPLPTLRKSLENKFLGHNKMSEFIQKR
jgi:Fe-S cluster assembly protein SufD